MRIVIDLPGYIDVSMARWWMKLFGSSDDPHMQKMFKDHTGADIREYFKFWILDDHCNGLFSNQESCGSTPPEIPEMPNESALQL